jgi:hypothetical protein
MSYYRTYQEGKTQEVWKSLGWIHIREKSEITSDIDAVLCLTMERVRTNIHSLIKKLPELGYTFGYPDYLKPKPQIPYTVEDLFGEVDPDVYDSCKKVVDEMNAEEPNADWILNKPPLFLEPPEETEHYLDEIESLAGILPLSIRYFYQAIGAVSFMGTPPEHWKTKEEYFPNRMNEIHSIDPLYLVSLQQILQQKRYKLLDEGYEIYLAADEWFKEYKHDMGGYGIRVPETRIDPDFLYEWHQTTFYNYLRICFEWGGLPGLECATVPPSELVYLREGILPI